MRPDRADRASGPALERFFWPASIAVIGASGSPHTLSARPLRILQQHGYSGRLYPVNPRHGELLGLPCYPSVTQLPEIPDLALVLVNASAVPAVVDACGRAGVANVVVISSGFAEQSAGGAARRDQLRAVLDRHRDLALAGPNSEGFINTYGAVPASFSPAIDHERGLDHLLTGPVAVVAQSGGLGFALFNDGQARGLGFSYVVTTGNEDGLTALEYVDYLLDDRNVGVVLLFVEGLRNGYQLPAVAAKARAAGKPLVVAKAGRSAAGRRAAQSHTASLAGSDQIYDAVFRRHGILRAEDQEELVDLGLAFSWAPRPAGNRVAVLTYSGGAGVWTADALAAEGLEVPRLSPRLQEAIRALIPAYGSAANPVDVTAQVVQTAGGLAPVLELLAGSDEVDAVIVTTTLSSAQLLRAEEAALAAALQRSGKPVLAYSYTRPAAAAVEILARIRLPWFTSGRRAARALRALRDYRQFAERHDHRPSSAAPAAPGCARVGDPGPWVEWRAKAALREAGLPVPDGELAPGAATAAAAASRIGYPVAVKAQSAALTHKTEAGAVMLGLVDEAAVTAAVGRITAHLAAAAPGLELEGWLVERMCPAGTEMIVGVLRDPELGPAVVAGFGGIYAEILRDTVCLPAPLTADEARQGIARLRGEALLRGARGQPAADVDAFAELIAALGDLAVAHPEIAELDLNPVLVGPPGHGAWIADAAGQLSRPTQVIC
jgi:acetate---CoA ligase (ADP-forming)